MHHLQHVSGLSEVVSSLLFIGKPSTMPDTWRTFKRIDFLIKMRVLNNVSPAAPIKSMKSETMFLFSQPVSLAHRRSLINIC